MRLPILFRNFRYCSQANCKPDLVIHRHMYWFFKGIYNPNSFDITKQLSSRDACFLLKCSMISFLCADLIVTKSSNLFKSFFLFILNFYVLFTTFSISETTWLLHVLLYVNKQEINIPMSIRNRRESNPKTENPSSTAILVTDSKTFCGTWYFLIIPFLPICSRPLQTVFYMQITSLGRPIFYVELVK